MKIVLYVNGVAGKAKSLSNASKKFAEGAYKENVEPALRVVLQVWKDEKGYWLNKTDLAKQPLITPLRQADGAFPVDLQKSMTDKFYSVLTANAFYNGAMTSKAYVIAATKAMIEEGLAKTLARKPEKDISAIDITKAAENAVKYVINSDEGNSQPSKCNIGVNYAFIALTNNTILGGKLANEMGSYFASSSNFTKIDISKAQNDANNGEIIIASWINPSGKGHVCMVVPNPTPFTDGTWNGTSNNSNGGIPYVMDTGVDKRETKQEINKSFGKTKHANAYLYKYVKSK